MKYRLSRVDCTKRANKTISCVPVLYHLSRGGLCFLFLALIYLFFFVYLIGNSKKFENWQSRYFEIDTYLVGDCVSKLCR